MAKQDVNFGQFDRLERIYSRAIPKGSTGGTNMDMLNNLDYLTAIGWMERAQPFGGAVLRAVFTGNTKLAEIYIKAELYFNSRQLKSPLTEPETAFMAQLAVNEHTKMHSLVRCGKCKGKGTAKNHAPNELCEACPGDGVAAIWLRSFTTSGPLRALGWQSYQRR